ncbi:hypothetical protein [Marinobacter sp. 1_MG-2023]|uniref:hypothetical protein n=1 Tax=Marinobacter sp. 1_MG-2023 TaxID=3062627 RepID=UPI0026E1F43F|nr:hypothetical protein [Marinobacter sp. 1_MG-2023]MDO6822135.1 hypothetical protein [Marinobacter sp. 1_MG-2023]
MGEKWTAQNNGRSGNGMEATKEKVVVKMRSITWLTASVTGPGGSVSASASETDISYGIGAGFDIRSNIQMNAEYMSYIDKEVGFTPVH